MSLAVISISYQLACWRQLRSATERKEHHGDEVIPMLLSVLLVPDGKLWFCSASESQPLHSDLYAQKPICNYIIPDELVLGIPAVCIGLLSSLLAAEVQANTIALVRRHSGQNVAAFESLQGRPACHIQGFNEQTLRSASHRQTDPAGSPAVMCLRA